jgi:hypothetical protein
LRCTISQPQQEPKEKVETPLRPCEF